MESCQKCLIERNCIHKLERLANKVQHRIHWGSVLQWWPSNSMPLQLISIQLLPMARLQWLCTSGQSNAVKKQLKCYRYRHPPVVLNLPTKQYFLLEKFPDYFPGLMEQRVPNILELSQCRKRTMQRIMTTRSTQKDFTNVRFNDTRETNTCYKKWSTCGISCWNLLRSGASAIFSLRRSGSFSPSLIFDILGNLKLGKFDLFFKWQMWAEECFLKMGISQWVEPIFFQ